MSKRSKTISHWDYLAADAVPLIEKRRSKYHDQVVLKDTLLSAMKKLWPDGLRANECTEELFFIRSLAFRLSRDMSAKQLIDQALYDLPFDYETKLETLQQTKQIIYNMFVMGLVGLCVISGARGILKTVVEDDPHSNMVFVANMFIIAIVEAYEKTASKWKLRKIIKPGVKYFSSNCQILRAVLIEFKADGIELNGACSSD
jgi:hypothetical protein